MDTIDTTNQRAVFTLLGELSADVKHILSALDRNQRETEKLRIEFREETDDMKDRLARVERFNIRVLTYASIALPLFSVVVSFGKDFLLKALM